MNLTMLLNMVAEGMPERVLIGDAKTGFTGAQLRELAYGGAAYIESRGVDTVVFLGGNGPGFPGALFASAYSGRPFLPINYRLGDEQLSEILARRDKPLVITDMPERVGDAETITIADFMKMAEQPASDPGLADMDPSAIAVLLMTSGTTAAPKSAVLRHRHLMSYIFGSVDFASAEDSEATIVSIPPYHIAAVANLRRLCEEHLVGKCRVEVIDLLEHPQLAQGDQILAIPTLVRKLPAPMRKIIGDLSNADRVLVGLDLRAQ